ncbi:MAG: hypothetical protein ABIP39_04820 [Polyangiaceae bacterium]
MGAESSLEVPFQSKQDDLPGQIAMARASYPAVRASNPESRTEIIDQ